MTDQEPHLDEEKAPIESAKHRSPADSAEPPKLDHHDLNHIRDIEGHLVKKEKNHGLQPAEEPSTKKKKVRISTFEKEEEEPTELKKVVFTGKQQPKRSVLKKGSSLAPNDHTESAPPRKDLVEVVRASEQILVKEMITAVEKKAQIADPQALLSEFKKCWRQLKGKPDEINRLLKVLRSNEPCMRFP
jgi:hypothetical protein